MTYPPGASGRPDGGGRIARRRLEQSGGAMTSVATLLPSEPPPPSPVPTGRTASRQSNAFRVQMALVAAALVIALVAAVGVAVLWSANRKLASEVDAAVEQSALAESEAARLRVALDQAPDTATVEALANRVGGVEAWTGMPQEVNDAEGMDDLQTRLVEVSNGIDSLATNLEDGLGGVRNDLATVRNDLSSGPEPPSAAEVSALRGEVDALRGDLGSLRSSIEGIRQDVGVLCWALGYRKDVSASC